MASRSGRRHPNHAGVVGTLPEALESAFPHFETDASFRRALEKVQKLKELPTPADVRQLLQKLKGLTIQLKIPLSQTEKLLLLT